MKQKASDYVGWLKTTGALGLQDGQSDKSPLHYAIEKRDVDLVRLLLDLAGSSRAVAAATRTSGARCASLEAAMLSARTGTGNAALHLAVSVRHMVRAEQRRLVQLLLSKGADPSAKNGEGQLPREMTNDKEVFHETYVHTQYLSAVDRRTLSVNIQTVLNK